MSEKKQGKIYILKRNRIIQFFLKSSLLAAAALYVVFSFYQCNAVFPGSGENTSKFTSLLPKADDIPNISHPVSVPPPALSGERNGSPNHGPGNKPSHLLSTAFTQLNHSVFFLHKNKSANITAYPLRLHLAFCVFRI